MRRIGKKRVSLIIVLSILIMSLNAFADSDWICSNCGRENDEEIIFCPKCGQLRQDRVQCPSCGKIYSVYDEYGFCPACGSKLPEVVIDGTDKALALMSNGKYAEADEYLIGLEPSEEVNTLRKEAFYESRVLECAYRTKSNLIYPETMKLLEAVCYSGGESEYDTDDQTPMIYYNQPTVLIHYQAQNRGGTDTDSFQRFTWDRETGEYIQHESVNTLTKDDTEPYWVQSASASEKLEYYNIQREIAQINFDLGINNLFGSWEMSCDDKQLDKLNTLLQKVKPQNITVPGNEEFVPAPVVNEKVASERKRVGPIYEEAKSLEEQGLYAEAIEKYESISDYQDSAERIDICKEKAKEQIRREGKTASERGFGGDVTVYLKLEGKMVKDLVIDTPNEIEGLGKRASDKEFTDQFVGKEGPFTFGENEIDALSGSTVTSTAALKAINFLITGEKPAEAADEPEMSAMASEQGFGGKVTVRVETDLDQVVKALTVETPDETEGIGKRVSETVFTDQFIGKTGPFTFGENGIEAVSGATVTSTAALKALNRTFVAEEMTEETEKPAEAADEPKMSAMAWEHGFGGKVTVRVETDLDQVVKALTIETPDETEGIGKRVSEAAFTDQFIGKTGPFTFGENGIEAVSGATVTSTAALKAINKLITEAKSEEAAMPAGEADDAFIMKVQGTEPGFIGDVTVQLELDGKKVIGLVIDAPDEIESMGKRVTEAAFTDQFIGKTGPFTFGENGIEAISCATVTSTAALKAINKLITEVKPAEQALEQNEIGGYVSASNVNFREEPSVQSQRIMRLSKYAYLIILDTVDVDGTMWCKVQYGDLTGYINADYVRIMEKDEKEAFLQSDEYKQGLLNNAQ